VNVLSINMGSDPAGISYGIAQAFRGVLGWSVRSQVSKQNYITYPTDLEWNREALITAWESADLIHLHHGFVTSNRMVKGRYVGKRLQNKPYLVHFHGTGFREHIQAHMTELRERNTLGIVSTLDLAVASGLEWLPAPTDVELMQGHRWADYPERAVENDYTVRIAHAPTNRQIKSTAAVIEAVERMKAEGLPVELDLIERVPWAECIARKAKADIYFDQVLLGYGNNALEAWAMSIPVVAGADDATLDEMERRFGHLPFYHATEDTIYDALKELVESPELRERYGQIGQAYVRKYHDYPVVVEQLKRIYRQALGEQEKAA
jgi:hypothetical protein